MKNPCRNCELAFVQRTQNGKQYHKPNPISHDCRSCENRKKHEIELKAKRRYIKGEPIRSVEEFAQCKDTLFYWFDHPVHIEILKSLQYRTLEKFISSGMLYIAILIDK